MFETRRQLLTRFLKDNKIYHRIISSNKINMIYALLGKREITVRFFDDGMCWGNTNEGHNFWLKIQCEFVLFILENDKNHCFQKDEIKSYFYTLITSGYFDGHNMDKTSEYYLSFKEKYRKIFG